MTNLFEKLNAYWPPQAEQQHETAQATKERVFSAEGLPRAPSQKFFLDRKPISPVQRLLDWLQNEWDEETVTPRDIRIWGPYSLRNRESVANLTRILASHGWLIPLPTRQYGARRWQIVPREGKEGPSRQHPV